MIKQISLKKENKEVIALMNEKELFRISNDNKTIDINHLYNELALSVDDLLENKISENLIDDTNSIDVIYDNLKVFFDDLIAKINDTIKQFDEKKEENNLLNQEQM